MNSHHNEQFECYNHSFELGDDVGVFGGESWVDEYYMDEYGIDMGNVGIYNIPSEQFKNLALQMINHLIVNGHGFHFVEKDGYRMLDRN